MSRINFASLASKFPQYKKGLKGIENWLNRHPEARVIDPMVISREMKSIGIDELAQSLTLLEKVGELTRVYKVLTPSGVLADGEFDDPRSIPERLPDRFDQYFDTRESNIVPVFRLVA